MAWGPRCLLHGMVCVMPGPDTVHSDSSRLTGRDGIGAIILRMPSLLVARMRQTDRWDQRIGQLAVFHHEHGHARVPAVRSQPSCTCTAGVHMHGCIPACCERLEAWLGSRTPAAQQSVSCHVHAPHRRPRHVSGTALPQSRMDEQHLGVRLCRECNAMPGWQARVIARDTASRLAVLSCKPCCRCTAGHQQRRLACRSMTLCLGWQHCALPSRRPGRATGCLACLGRYRVR